MSEEIINPFEEIMTGRRANSPTETANPFAQIAGNQELDTDIGVMGAGTRAAVRGALPAAGSLVAAGAGAELGAGLGLMTGPAAPIAAPLGGLIGGVAAGFAGATAVSAAQNWLLHKLPDSWTEALGQSDRQQRLDEQQQPTASFLGGLLPYALTMSPGKFTGFAVPEGATALQRIMSNPATSRVFGGGLMGGMELGQEAASGEDLNWRNIAIATGFGIVFNKPNKLGEAITEFGARPVRETLRPTPTIANAGDAKVAGPGVTEGVFQGTEDIAPAAGATNMAIAQAEDSLVNGAQRPVNLHEQVRASEPELFREYDNLTQMRDTFKEHLDNLGEGEDRAVIQNRLNGAQTLLDDLGPEVSAAYRRAAERHGVNVVEQGVKPEEAGSIENAPSAPTAPITGPSEAAKVVSADVEQKLLAAGRAPEQANAEAQLLAAHYDAWSELFGGQKGSALDMYKAANLEIKAVQPKPEAPEFSISQPPKAPNDLTFDQTRNGSLTVGDNKYTLKLFTGNDNPSTVVHEFSHMWLDELMRYAADPQAPQALKDDATTVLKSMKLTSSRQIKNSHHEQFAKWGEQYFREGVAPSGKLAEVFGKFKDWLTKIYSTIKNLGVPINDDIRGVFDRLLSNEPKRTVVVEENIPPKTLADIHENDANETEPHEAEAAADRISAERAQQLETLKPEIKNEIESAQAEIEAKRAAESGTGNIEPTGQVGPSAERNGEPARNGNESKSQSGSGGGGEANAAERNGGSESEAKGNELSPAPDSRTNPNRPIADRSGEFVDKAGNIRVELLNTTEDVGKVIKEIASQNGGFIGERRGIITDGQVIDLADSLGMDANELSKRKLGQTFNAEQIVAARMLLVQSAKDVRSAAQAVGEKNDIPTLIAFAEAKARHTMIQGQVSGITAEAGRALRAFHSLTEEMTDVAAVNEFLKKATGKTYFQLAQEAELIGKLDTPQQVSKTVRDSVKRSFGRMVLEYWINGLISGPATHSTYTIGNALLLSYGAGPETAMAALIGAGREALGNKGERVYFGEVPAGFKGAVQGLPAAIKGTMEAAQTGVGSLLPGETGRRSLPFQQGTELVTPAHIEQTLSPHELKEYSFSLGRGTLDAIKSYGTLLSDGKENAPLLGWEFSGIGAIPNLQYKGTTVLPVGTAARLPGRSVAMIHSFFLGENFSVNKSALAYRQATVEGLTGDAFKSRVADLWQNPTEEMMSKAVPQSYEKTLMAGGGQFVQTLSRLTNTEFFGFPFLKFIDPFVHITSNVISEGLLKRTPAGILAPEIRADLFGKNKVAQDMAWAKMILGTAVAIGFGAMKGMGLTTGSPPTDPREAAVWRLAGNQPFSVKIGDMWYDTHRLGSLGMMTGIAADMYDVAHSADLTEAAVSFAHSIAQTVLDESFMRGPAELIKAVEDPDRYGDRYIQNFLSSFVPFSVGSAQIARAVDPYSRQTRSIMDAIKSKVPGQSLDLLPRRNIWGEPISSRTALGGAAVSALWEQQLSHDPVNLALSNLGVFPSQLPRSIRNVDLTDDEYDNFSRIAGRMSKSRLDVIVKSPDWNTWAPHIQRDVITQSIKESREAARGIIMMKYPHIIHDATRARLEKLED
jgi:hypothetical protein